MAVKNVSISNVFTAEDAEEYAKVFKEGILWWVRGHDRDPAEVMMPPRTTTG